MKVFKRALEKDNGGLIVLLPENTEDMWHAYNLISVGDSVSASTIRKVTNESSTGSTTSSRIRTTLTISVENIYFDGVGSKLSCKGRNKVLNPFVKMGAYHTLDLEINSKFSLSKSEWDSLSLERIDLASDPERSVDSAAVIMQEGLAHVCLLSSTMTIVKAKIDVHIPRKRKGGGGVSQHEKALSRFYDSIISSILRHFNFENLKCVLLASPGFVKDAFFAHLLSSASNSSDLKVLLENKSKFLLVHSSSGFKHSLAEVLANPSVQSTLSDKKTICEIEAIQAFYKILLKEPTRAFYGVKDVFRAEEASAISTLLISDKLFRSSNVEERKKFVGLVEGVRKLGGDVKILSSLSVSGQQLDQLTGLAALLRFPMEEEEDFSSSSGNEDENENDETEILNI